jgi:hypothetical protein
MKNSPVFHSSKYLFRYIGKGKTNTLAYFVFVVIIDGYILLIIGAS